MNENWIRGFATGFNIFLLGCVSGVPPLIAAILAAWVHTDTVKRLNERG